MANFDTDDIVRLGCVLRLQDAYDIVNVWTVDILSGGGLAFGAASQDFQEWTADVYTYLTGYLSDLITAGSISVKNLTQNTVWGSMAWAGWSGGTKTDEATAPGVALLGWGRTTKSRKQLRKYFGVFTEGNLTDGVWDGTIRGAVTNAMTYATDANVMTNGLELQAKATTLPSLVTHVITSCTTSGEPAYQRRRKRGRGS